MYLGIDYGERHLGLAMSEGNFSSPKGVLAVKNLEAAANQVAQKIADWKISTVVIGLSEGKSKEKTLEFAKRLFDITGIKIDFVDETLSTKEAQELLGKRGHEDHSLAASIILQRFLDDLAGENQG